MKRIAVIVVFSLLFVENALALSVNGIGFGNTQATAREDALADLSQNIQVDVKSEFSSSQTQSGKNLDEMRTKAIHLKSDLPILGARFDSLPAKDGFKVHVILDDSARPLYETELIKTTDLISRNLNNLAKNNDTAAKVDLLQAILTHIEQYYKLRIVAQFLGSNKIPDISVTADDIAGRLSTLEKKADTLDFGMRLLARNLDKQNRYYIYPPTPDQSSEVTQFGRAVKDHLAAMCRTSEMPDKADRFLTGSYKILKDGIELTCHLIDKKNNTLKTGVVFLLPSAYAGYTVKPLSLDFEKLIQQGQVISGDYRVDIKTRKGKRDLLYTTKDTMSLMVKMNKPGYFYIVSHNLKEGATYSYIINFTDEDDDRKFIYYVGGEAVNKWLVLGEFNIVPPFGVESLQMVASTEDLVSRIPDHYYDRGTGLYTIGAPSGAAKKTHKASKPAEALRSTRGLIMKKKAASAEAVLIFTSMNAQ